MPKNRTENRRPINRTVPVANVTEALSVEQNFPHLSFSPFSFEGLVCLYFSPFFQILIGHSVKTADTLIRRRVLRLHCFPTMYVSQNGHYSTKVCARGFRVVKEA